MTAKEILVKAKELITDPACWTQKEFARRADGTGTMAEDPEAVCWCSLGAIRKAKIDLGVDKEAYWFVSKNLSDQTGFQNIGKWNDSVSHEEVMVVFDKAINCVSLTKGDDV